MFRQTIAAKFITLSLLVLTLDTNASARKRGVATPPYKIIAIQAKLYYHDKGTFSRDVLVNPNFAFWNVIIGGGDAEGLSDSTLVLVEVSRKSEEATAPPVRKVELTAVANGRVLLKRALAVGPFSDDHKFYAAFWLYDTGCEPVKLTARMLGQSQPSSLTRKIPFECGE
ncbi:MAG TPA: hypothetical protein VFH15_01905 [Pyrinomonadaceae bacterium]|nr:hypothetical protein [Pyrinomonadaceae bacterium]